MPSGSSSGVVHSVTLTPAAAGQLIVTATFDAIGTSGSDWGSSYSTKLYCTQNSVTVDGPTQKMGNARISQTIRGVFAVVAGLECTVGLYGTISGAVQADWYDVHITAELVKL